MTSFWRAMSAANLFPLLILGQQTQPAPVVLPPGLIDGAKNPELIQTPLRFDCFSLRSVSLHQQRPISFGGNAQN